VEIWAVSPDSAEDLEKFRVEEDLGFPLLVDPDLETVRAYGLLNQENPTVPHPTALVLDREGVVRYARVDENYRQRPSPEELLAALRKLEPPTE
jgi:peroxiredoxin